MNSGIYPSSQNPNVDFSRWITEMESEIINLEMVLAGMKLNDEGEFVKMPDQEEMINAKGRDVVLSAIKPILSKNTFMSDISVERTHELVLDMSHVLRCELFIKRFEYGIGGPDYQGDMATLDHIIYMAQVFAEMAYKRAGEGRERELSLSLHSTLTNIQQQSQAAEKKGFLEGFGLLPHHQERQKL